MTYHVQTNADPLLEFFEQRRSWLRVIPMQNDRGTWDIALVLDGSYSGALATPEELDATCEFFRSWLSDALAVSA